MKIGSLVIHRYTKSCGFGIVVEVGEDPDNYEPLYQVKFADGSLDTFYDNGMLEVICE